MKVEICLYASLASRLPDVCRGNSSTLDVGEGMSVRALLERLNISADEPKIMFLNGIHAKLDDLLKDGDRVAVFPPIAGG